MTTTFDFQDGKGPVPAHQHPNGGGWVADTARVEETAFVGPNAQVYGSALVEGGVQLLCGTRISGVSCVTYNPLHVSESSPSKVYIVVQARKSMFDSGYENDVVGVYLSREAAEKDYGTDNVTIEEHEVMP